MQKPLFSTPHRRLSAGFAAIAHLIERSLRP